MATQQRGMPDSEYSTRNTSRELAVVDATMTPELPMARQGFLTPLDTAETARAAIAAYENLKRAIIQPSDLQKISGREHIKKSGWLRIARAFGLTVEPVSERYETAEDGSWGYAIVVRAVAPNGASMQGDGLCWSSEKAPAQRTRHNVRAHAYTRATNRAISNLVGGGEVSAEEIIGDITEVEATPAPAQAAPAQQPPDRAGAAMRSKDIMDLLVARQRFTDADRRLELDAVFAAIEAAGATVNLKTVRAELQARLADAISLSGMDMGAPGN